MRSAGAATQFANRMGRGDALAAAELVPLIYDELRQLAARCMSRERAGHTLQPTALVNEVYLRLIEADGIDFRGRAQFFALAARQIRKILVDHARRRRAAKRGGGLPVAALTDDAAAMPEREIDLVELDDALSRLAERSQRQCQVVELRFFGGMGVEEVADVLGVSAATVKDDWAVARAWLRRELSEAEG